jgi:hypothetical protein
VSAEGASVPKGPAIHWLQLRQYITRHYELTQEQLNSVEQWLKHWVLFGFHAPKWPKRLPPWVHRFPIWESGVVALVIDEAWATRARDLEMVTQGFAKLLAWSQGKPAPVPPAADEAALRDLCGKWVQIRIPRKVIDDEVRTVRSRAPQAPKPEPSATEPQTEEPSLLNRSWPDGLPRAAPVLGLPEKQTAVAQVPDEAKAAAAEVRRQAAEEPGAPPTHPEQDGPTVKTEEPTQPDRRRIDVQVLVESLRTAKKRARSRDILDAIGVKFSCGTREAESLYAEIPKDLLIGSGGTGPTRREAIKAGRQLVDAWVQRCENFPRKA